MSRTIALSLLLVSCGAPAYAQTAPVNITMANGQPRPVTPVTQVTASSMMPGQVVVGTTATLVVPARQGRIRVILTVTAANTCAFGNAGVTLTTGFPLQPVAGASVAIDGQMAVYAVCSASTTIGELETF